MDAENQFEFWDLQASDLLAFGVAMAILGLGYISSRKERHFRHLLGGFSTTVLISGVLCVLVFLKSSDKIGEAGLIGLLGSLIGYGFGSMHPPMSEKPSNQSAEKHDEK